MKRASALLLVGTLLVTITLTACSSPEKEPEPAPAGPLTREESVDFTVKAKVKAVNYSTRVMTLEDAQGHQVTFVVDDSVRRLNEVRVGDEVKAQYRAKLLAELRAPTADETANPVAVISVSGRSPTGTTPAAGAVEATRVVTTVEAVDVPNMLVTLRGPMGDLVVVRGKNADNVKRIHVGDTIVITFTESVAISLEKIAPR